MSCPGELREQSAQRPNEPTAKAPWNDAYMNWFMDAEALEPGGSTIVETFATGRQLRRPGGRDNDLLPYHWRAQLTNGAHSAGFRLLPYHWRAQLTNGAHGAGFLLLPYHWRAQPTNGAHSAGFLLLPYRWRSQPTNGAHSAGHFFYITIGAHS